jgi:hypothetical protein
MLLYVQKTLGYYITHGLTRTYAVLSAYANIAVIQQWHMPYHT